MLEEYQRVFEYERLKHLDKRRIARLLGLLQRVGVTVKSRGRLKISEHEEDNRVYECAAAAKADYIVTGNRQHFPVAHQNTKIVNARQFLQLLASQ